MKVLFPVDVYVETVIGADCFYNRAVLELPNQKIIFATPHEFFSFALALALATKSHSICPGHPELLRAIAQAQEGLDAYQPGEPWAKGDLR